MQYTNISSGSSHGRCREKTREINGEGELKVNWYRKLDITGNNPCKSQVKSITMSKLWSGDMS